MEPRVITLPAQLCASAPRKPLCMKHFELDLLLLALDKSKGLTWSPGLSLSICGVGCQVPTQTSQWCQGAFEKAKTITKVSETIIHTHTHTQMRTHLQIATTVIVQSLEEGCFTKRPYFFHTVNNPFELHWKEFL
jgi:hypothetical protein